MQEQSNVSSYFSVLPFADVYRVSKNCLRLVVREQLPAAAVGQVLTRMSVVLEAVKLALRGMNAAQLPTHL